MKQNFIPLFFLILIAMSCKKTNSKKIETAQDIIDKAIAVSGGAKIDDATVSFRFRNKTYKAFRRFGNYQLERSFVENDKVIIDILDNEKFERFENFEKVKLEDSTLNKYKGSVNSVHYFAALPYGLNAEAVKKKYIDTVRIKGKKYHKIEVTFNEENGGEDFDDVFLYWINVMTYKVDYLAYEYHVNGGGKRFREAYNERIVDQIRFVDYNNYKPANKTTDLDSFDRLYEENQLKLLSKIEIDSIAVK